METQTARPPAARTRIALAAFLWSLTAIPVGLWQLLDPDGGPFVDEARRPTIVLPDAVPDSAPALGLIVAGLAGLFLAGSGARLWPIAALYAVVFTLCVPTTLIAFAGYLSAFVIPLVLVVGPILLARKPIPRVLAAATVAAVIAALAVAGPLSPETIGDLGRELGAGAGEIGVYPLAEAWSALGGTLWAFLAVQQVRSGRGDRPAPAWLASNRAARWGKIAAYVAFACALPYGLTRMSWFTPWPYLVTREELEAHPDMRLWGLLLGFAALGGGVLCLGLTQRWGERWPYWVPGLRGRPVPPKVAIVPASIVTCLFTLSGVSLPVMGLRQGNAEFIWLFPFFIWGPALGAATLAYAIRRGVFSP